MVKIIIVKDTINDTVWTGEVGNADRIWARTPQNLASEGGYALSGAVRKPHLPYLRVYGEIRKSRLPGGGSMFGKNVRWICRESEFPPTEEQDASVKTFEFTRVICYDVSGVERTYQFLLQCLQSDVHAAADNFRGCRALLPLSPSEGR